jgi:uncharacterized phage protein (predicted DNA packaging)
MTLVSLAEAKLQCRVEYDFTDEDLYLQLLIDAAINKVETNINKRLIAAEGIADEQNQNITPAIKMAVLLLVGHWYTNREAVVTGTITTSLPLAYESLINSYREIAVG